MHFYNDGESNENGIGNRKDESDCCGQFFILFAHIVKLLKDIYNSFISQRPFGHMILHINV